MQATICTAHDGHGGTCGRADLCTHVTTMNAANDVLHDHWVCAPCRVAMGLPERDVILHEALGEV